MKSIAAEAIDAAIIHAQEIGIFEDTFTIGNCELVLQNLRPDQQVAAIKEIEHLENQEYLFGFQKGQIARSIVQVNGVNLRGVEFIETKVPDPKDASKVKVVLRERHDWIQQNIVSTWGSEAVFVVYRKFMDLTDRAGRECKEGLTFILPEETPEDQFRRLLREVKELEESVPPLLLRQILEESGYMLRSDLKSDSDNAPAPVQEETQEAPPEATPQPQPPSRETPSDGQGFNVAEALRRRVPIHQQGAVSQETAPQVQASSQPAPVRTPPPVSMRAPQPAPSSPEVRSTSKRSAEMADLMGGSSLGLDDSLRKPPPQAVTPPTIGNPVLQPTIEEPTEQDPHKSSKRLTVPSTLAGVIDQPSPVGINPRFRPQQR